MKLVSTRWLGITTDQPEAMVRFLREALGLRVRFAEQTTTELALDNGDRVQVFGPGSDYQGQYHSQGIVVLFEVDDVHAARMLLQRAGIQVSELRSDATWEWIDVRAPDGRLYLLASTRANGEGGGS